MLSKRRYLFVVRHVDLAGQLDDERFGILHDLA
jgi:hypothetical protein